MSSTGEPLCRCRVAFRPSASAVVARRSTKSEVFETGIKVIDVLMPLERGGKAGLFGGAGVGKTVLLSEMIHDLRQTTGRREYFLWRWESAVARERNFTAT